MQGIELFSKQNGRMPDLILLQSLFWDIAAFVMERDAEGSHEAAVMTADALPQSFLDEYVTGITEVISEMKVSNHSRAENNRCPYLQMLMYAPVLNCQANASLSIICFKYSCLAG